MKTVLIIDDHPAYRAGLKTIIENGGYHVTGEAGTADEGFRLACELKPDVVIIDLQLPDKHGILLAEMITEAPGKTYVMIITAHSETSFVTGSLQAGAKGYVLKESDIKIILECLDTVLNGKQYIDKTLFSDSGSVNGKNDRYRTLSNREQDVMRLIVDNYSLKEIAVKLNISSNTVKSHRTSIYEKIGVKDKSELILYAAGIGLTDSDTW